MRVTKAFTTGFALIALLACMSVPAQQAKSNLPPKAAAQGQQPASANSGAELTAADLEAFLDGVMPMQLQRADIAGAVVAVVKDGKVLFAKGYGYADVEGKKPVSAEDTLFRPGSISKLFT